MGVIDILIEDARAKGFEKGYKIGISLSYKEAINRTFSKALIDDTDFDNAKIATLVGVSEEYVANLRVKLSKQ
jgi:hypothetical protein